MKTPFIEHLQSALSQITTTLIQITGSRQVFGGDINATYLILTNEEKYFIKINANAFADMLRKEKEGLLLLRTAGSKLKIPEPILHGTFGEQSYLLMEYLEKGTDTKALWQQLAIGLAQIHQTKSASFGLDDDNYIGTVVQKNAKATTWAQFYAQQRIMPLMMQAYNQQKCTTADVQLAEQCCNHLSAIFSEEPPALLHGDLWSGNRMFTTSGEAAIYDPAVYFGNREMDIAMTLLFGGFDTIFYDTYNEVHPLQQGWRQRIDICQLYPLLVHLILFGGHYYTGVKRILKKYA